MPMPTPSWVPWGNSSPFGRGGCGSEASGVVSAAGVGEALGAGQSGGVGVGSGVGGWSRVSGCVMGGSSVDGGFADWSSGMSYHFRSDVGGELIAMA